MIATINEKMSDELKDLETEVEDARQTYDSADWDVKHAQKFLITAQDNLKFSEEKLEEFKKKHDIN